MQPQWITPAGSLGTIPENVFYRVSLEAQTDSQDVFFQLLAGNLPDGIQVTSSGIIEGVPKTTVDVRGVPQDVDRDTTSKFAVRAYTRRLVSGQFVLDRLADRTFEITVTGQNVPTWITPAGRVAIFIDATEASVQLEFEEPDATDQVRVELISGQLPPGLSLDARTGFISGIVLPIADLAPSEASQTFSFTLAVTDGKDANIRAFEILVYNRQLFTADDTDITSDNTEITADVTPDASPILLTPAGEIGPARADNYFAFRFRAIDFDDDDLEYVLASGAVLPPGLQLDAVTGWLYGYIPDQGATQETYVFALQVQRVSDPATQSAAKTFDLTIVGDIDLTVEWLTPPNLGSIDNGAISDLAVRAVNAGGRSMTYRLAPGTSSQLPQGLTLLPSGNIVGRVSFNTFALDGGSTTFDADSLPLQPTTFDLEFRFTVNAFAAESQQPVFGVDEIVIIDGGSGYSGQPTITISAPPATENSVQATAGTVTIVAGVITGIALSNPGQGYVAPPTITITGGSGSGAEATSTLRAFSSTNAVSVLRTFTLTVNRRFNQPYETLYIKAMPPEQDRALISALIQNPYLIPQDLVYRNDDPNFGVAKSVIYDHAYGLTASTIQDYVSALDINHYLKNLVLGPIRTAQALDANGTLLYEVVYSEIIDDLVNSQGVSVGKNVELPYPVLGDDSVEITEVYPNSLINMRDQIIDTVGQISPALPRWMTSKQQDGRVLGFRPAWVIAFVVPGAAGRIAYNIRTQLGEDLNMIDFEVDRYTLDRSQTRNWNPDTEKWIPSPPVVTTFDDDTTVFDGRSTIFVAPADRWFATDEFDKYLMFPKRTILG